MEKLYTLNPKALWAQFKKEHFAFWMICAYLILQYFDPLQIYPSLKSLPLHTNMSLRTATQLTSLRLP